MHLEKWEAWIVEYRASGRTNWRVTETRGEAEVLVASLTAMGVVANCWRL